MIGKKAFAIQLRDKDISGAQKKVDEVIPIFEGRVRTFFPGDVFKTIQKAMTHYDPLKVYILPVGSSVANLITGISIGLRNPKQVKLLVFDEGGQYKEVVLNLEKLRGK